MVKKLLLQEYKNKGKNQLILKTYSGDNQSQNLTEYYTQLLDKHSIEKVRKILEIYPSETNPQGTELRKRGFEVVSLPFSININAVGENEDGKHYIIGETFNFPQLNELFDAIIVSQGIFGQILQITDIKSFLSDIYKILIPNGILLTEIWHSNGVEKDSKTKKGHKDWEIISSKDNMSIIRLTNSMLNMFSNILEVEIKYIIENEIKKTLEKYNETHLYKLYNISELVSLYNENQFNCKTVLKMNSLDEPEIETFRLMCIAQKISF